MELNAGCNAVDERTERVARQEWAPVWRRMRSFGSLGGDVQAGGGRSWLTRPKAAGSRMSRKQRVSGRVGDEAGAVRQPQLAQLEGRRVAAEKGFCRAVLRGRKWHGWDQEMPTKACRQRRALWKIRADNAERLKSVEAT
ncbi:hypothetical protein E4U53_004056, partial [Claviceps sorghi]